jgi:hypothetical protein
MFPARNLEGCFCPNQNPVFDKRFLDQTLYLDETFSWQLQVWISILYVLNWASSPKPVLCLQTKPCVLDEPEHSKLVV